MTRFRRYGWIFWVVTGGAAWFSLGCEQTSPGDSHPGSVISPAAVDSTSGSRGFRGDSCVPCHDSDGSVRATGREGWLPTCTTSNCHPQAWNETIHHRVDPEVFKDCTNCHRPHVWKAVGNDCLSCHGTGGTRVAMAAMTGAPFPHDRHAGLECATCHESTDRHAALLMTSPEQCQSCHHGPPAVASCNSCHAATELAGNRAMNVMMKLSRGTPARQRKMNFDHARHAGLACASCHDDPIGGRVNVDCAGCHRKHDRPEAACTTCHQAPSKDVHPITVHDTGCAASGCHTDNGIQSTSPTRGICLSCHTTQVSHQPGKICASCHMVTLGHGGSGS